MPGLSDSCGVCKTTYLFSLPRCGFCRRPVCANCASRIGGSIFCGKTCGHTFFYGAEEDIEDGEKGNWEDEDE
jgi:hypothetical protein